MDLCEQPLSMFWMMYHICAFVGAGLFTYLTYLAVRDWLDTRRMIKATPAIAAPQVMNGYQTEDLRDIYRATLPGKRQQPELRRVK